MRLTIVFKEFFESEKAGGFVLVFVTLISLFVANSPLGVSYIRIWHFELGGHSIVHWINDGLMTIFFLLIGLELEREIYRGELSNLKNALLPIFGAIGGMIIPALFYFSLNKGSETASGTGIPMATDIAFAIGVLSLLGSRVPSSLKVFLTAIAVIDDLGAIILIAFFYTTSFSFTNLFISLAIFLVLIILNRIKVRNLIVYLVPGIAMWYFLSNSGVHASITGVMLAFAIPFGDGKEKSPSFLLQHVLHKTVAFIILPIFALANTCIILGGGWYMGLGHLSGLGIISGLALGKPFGIWLFSYLAVTFGICTLPIDLKWNHIIGAGMLGGIGFTMSMFITLLAFDSAEIINTSKIAILVASLISGIVGLVWLKMILKR